MRIFGGVKIALLQGNKVLVILRDDKPGLPFAGWWDLPGGGREGVETPVRCALREVKEELGLRLPADAIVWQKAYPRIDDPAIDIFFMAAHITADDVAAVTFGSEGQAWCMLQVADFMQDVHVIDQYKPRLQEYLQTLM